MVSYFCRILCLIVLSATLLLAPSASVIAKQKAQDIAQLFDIQYTKFILPNGLTVIVHEDHKSPIVAVNVWYHVGSKDEPVGKQGFAHLFEHLMFNGSQNYNKDIFYALENMGATEMNGTTNTDRTNYFQNVPKEGLERVLWLEADRMGFLTQAVDQKKLDEQRGVVLNEKKQREGEPLGKLEETLAPLLYPANHPYSWTTIGNEKDLKNATLEDVKNWHKTYYGPANATLVIAGDVQTSAVKTLVEKYFGDISSGPGITKLQSWVAPLFEEKRVKLKENINQAKLMKVWNVPGLYTHDFNALDIASDILSISKQAPLYKRFVEKEKIATSVNAYVNPAEIGSQFVVEVDLVKPEFMEKAERILQEELALFFSRGIADEHLKRAKAQIFGRMLTNLEKIGGSGGKSFLLAESEMYTGSPDAFKENMYDIQTMKREEVQKIAKNWLSLGSVVATIYPFDPITLKPSALDRTKMPEMKAPQDPKFPKQMKHTLTNTIEMIFLDRKTVPLVQFDFIFEGGFASDPTEKKGISLLMLKMMAEGSKKYPGDAFSLALQSLGAKFSSSASLDQSVFSLVTPRANAEEALKIVTEVIRSPLLPTEKFLLHKQTQINKITSESKDSFGLALQVFPKILYGENHPYATNFNGSGSISDVKNITLQDVTSYIAEWIQPKRAKIVVIGDAEFEESKKWLQNTLGTWQNTPTKSEKKFPKVAQSPSALYVYDQPGLKQSMIFAGQMVPPKSDDKDLALTIVNGTLGGTFTSRLNMNIREDKHWSYGVRSVLLSAQKDRPLLIYGSVQIDKTRQSIEEIMKEIRDITSVHLVTESELSSAKNNLTLSLPGKWETNTQVMGSAREMIRFGLPENYFDTYPKNIRALSLDTVQKAAKSIISLDRFVWVVITDKAKTLEELKKLGLPIFEY